MGVGFGGGGNAGQVKGGGGVIVPADGNDSAGGEGEGGKHVVVRREWRACSLIWADVDEGPFKEAM